MDFWPWLILILFLAGGVFYLWLRRDVVIFQYERALLYRDGRFVRVLEPGRHVLFGRWHSVQKLDIRSQMVSIPGQEVLSADNIALRISLGAMYKVQDPYVALTTTVNYHQALYLALQLILRELVGSEPVDSFLEKRSEIGRLLLERGKPQAAALGLELQSAEIKDIMFPGDLKKVFAQVVNARKEGQAALERARGESAALRNLLNAARLLQETPALLQLRTLQAVGSGSGNTLILNLDQKAVEAIPATLRPASAGAGEAPAQDDPL